ncbi:hypothetical protein HF521_002608 [Silurus meridionalis]|uniref:Uncharacterized protein n=1 Tax=Silurus meridionalis TaxID=175797 RepID=A0A8T0B7V3_SILME|nr:hypothetical protein HF521_002608 [Silurus meridionalis]
MKVPVVVMMHHLNTNTHHRDVQCVYWNFNENGGLGGWSPSGCWTHNTTPEYTTCMCDHLTHFGVLLDVSRTPIDEKNEKVLTLITYTGCGVSSFFLGVTVLTYSLLEKLRCDYPSQILLNLSFALLGLNLVFLVNSWLSSFGLTALCVAVATIQHYFLLASFIWMLLEAVNMYFAIIKVFNSYVPSYILKFCCIGWGVPLLVCCMVLVVKPDSYGLLPLANSEMFCWVSEDVVFYVCVVGVVGVVLLVNISVFLMVLLQMRRACLSEHSGVMKELRGITSLTLLLGLTWSAAFLTWGDARIPLLYMFSILNSLQGFFIFVFQCLMKENVRKQWRVHLCFGRFTLQEYSGTKSNQSAERPEKPSPASWTDQSGGLTGSTYTAGVVGTEMSGDSDGNREFHEQLRLQELYGQRRMMEMIRTLLSTLRTIRGYRLHVEAARFELKGQYDASKKKKKNKEYRKKLQQQQKQLDWRPEKQGDARKRHERVVIIRNMFHPSDFEEDPLVLNEYRDDLRSECEKFGEVKKVLIFDRRQMCV